MAETNNGYSMTHLPLFQALTEHVLFAGVPMTALLFLGGVTLLFIAAFHFWYIIGLTVPLYLLGIYLAQNDAQVFDCYLIYKAKNDYYAT